jgi:catechol 2,3-dioxygenase-like lactoylglutathione lyase family enzyme
MRRLGRPGARSGAWDIVKGVAVAQVTLGNHAAVVVSRTEQDAVRRFYRDVLGCALTRSANDKDDFVLGGDFYLAVVYADEAVTLGKEDFLKATYLELRTDDVAEMRQQIVDFGVKVIEIDDPHLYFQAPGGQAFRLVGMDEDMSKYEGTTRHRELPSDVFS